MNIIELFIGIAIGFIVTWLFTRIMAKNKLAINSEREKAIQMQYLEVKETIKYKETLLLQLTGELSSFKNENKNLLEKLKEEKEAIRTLNEKMNLEFKNLANEILEQKSNLPSRIKKTLMLY
jgi:DNA recombination protein RmuC